MDNNIDREKLRFVGMFLNNIKRDEVQNKLGNSETLNCIFNHLDKLDGNADGNVEAGKIFNSSYLLSESENTLFDNLTSEIHTGVDKGGILGDTEFIIDDEKIQKYIDENPDLKNVTKEDFKDCLSKLIEYGDEKLKDRNEKYLKEQLARHPELPEAVATQIDIERNENVKVVQENGKNYYEVSTDDGQWRKYSENGTLVALKSESLAVSESEDMFNTLGAFDEIMLFSEEDEEQIGEIRRYQDNDVREYVDYQNNTLKRTLGKTEFNFKDDRLDSIKINNGLPNETGLECLYDENGSLKDFKLSSHGGLTMTNADGINMPSESPIKMDNAEKEMLKTLLNSGAKFGEDFSLDLQNNKLTLNPIIKNDTDEQVPASPQSLRDEVYALAQKGLRNNRDYTLTYNKDGSFEIDFETAKARNFETEDTRIIYSKDGKTKVTHTIEGDSIKTLVESEYGQNVSIQSRKDAFLEKLLEGDFKATEKTLGDIRYQGSDFDFYAVCKEYEKVTGKKFIDEILKSYDNGNVDEKLISKLIPNSGGVIFMGEISEEDKKDLYKETVRETFEENMEMFNEVNNFDVSKSQVSDLIYKNEKEKINDNKYTEVSNGAKYTVTKNNDFVTVEKDGKSYTLDLKNINPNIREMIFNSNANVIYRLASEQIKVSLYSNTGRTGLNNNDINGSFEPDNNEVKLNAETMTPRIMQRTLAHETGHSFYTPETSKNEQLEAAFKEELEQFNNSDEKFKDGDHTYCATNVYEMVAESYTLLTTGHAKSEYTLAKHFPKTFALVKQLIEEQTK